MTIGKAHLSCLSVLFMCSAILGCQSVSGLAGEGDFSTLDRGREFHRQ